MSPSLKITFPPELPITGHVAQISQALAEHQVVIVCGDTGSGKTTQLPKIALQAGRGKRGMIGCTQPRRLAALAMARRVAEEFGQEPGRMVGYQHRFDKRLGRDTVVKFMTDGILLAETRRDPLFRAYDTLIVDEAHERSLNIDFLLGLLKRVLMRRRDLKLIISSATLDVGRFAAFFDHAPVISVPGRLYPIETRWRPAEDQDDPDLPRQVANACDELMAEGDGDILVFLPGERDIREVGSLLGERNLPRTEIIPLLASLPAAEQQRAFRTSDRRRIILSTNVAETSVTLPGIRYVVDSGLARISRYAPRTQVQRLQVEAISQASAAQRQGRCGRLASGICIRLYSEDDFKKREHFTPPEILRSKLSKVILTMLDLRLGRIEEFPLIEAPSASLIREGYRELELLGALRENVSEPRLSPVGCKLASLPLDPALAAILLAAQRERALADALIVVAALECDDPRRRPLDKQSEADLCHARFLSPLSDFAAFLQLWRWYHDAAGHLSQAALRRLCKSHFISYPRMRDWQDLREQLEGLCHALRFDVQSTSGGATGLHRALLAGLLGKIGKRDPESGDYRGAHGLRFAIFPASGLVKARERRREERMEAASINAKRAKAVALPSREWIMAGGLVETSRLFARTVACIEVGWIEELAARHCKYSYYAPSWDGQRGFVKVKERVVLFGLTLSEGRTRDYSRINASEAREIFIREGLVHGAFPPPVPPCLRANLARAEALVKAEEKSRRHGALFDPEVAYSFYAEHLPQDICSAPQLRRWLREAQTGEQRQARLSMTEADLPPAGDLSGQFPDSILLQGNRLPLSYRYVPGEVDDGITCTVPRELLPLTAAWHSDWLVPGLLDEKIRWLLALLPSRSRRLLQPLDETVALCRSRMVPGRQPLAQALAEALYAVRSLRVEISAWQEEHLPDYLRMRFEVVDSASRVIGQGREAAALMRRFGKNGSTSASAGGAQWQRDGLKQWDFGPLPLQVDVGRAGWPVINYPALVDAQESVSIRLFAESARATAAHSQGLARLYALVLGREFTRYRQPLCLPRGAALYAQQAELSAATLGIEVGMAAVRETFVEGRVPVRDACGFAAALQAGRGNLHRTYLARARLVTAILELASEVEGLLLQVALPERARDDLGEQLAWLIFPGFAANLDSAQLSHLPRYLAACRLRIERAQGNPDGDARKQSLLEPHWQRYVQWAAAPEERALNPLLLADYRWQVEELRVSLFAQELRTPAPVSAQRLEALWRTILESEP